MNLLGCLDGPGGLRIDISFAGFLIIWSGNLSGDMLEGDTTLGDILAGDRLGGGESKRFGNGWTFGKGWRFCNGWKLATGTLGRSDSKLLLRADIGTGLESVSWSGFSSLGIRGNADFGDPNVATGNGNGFVDFEDPNEWGSVLMVAISFELKTEQD